MIALLGGIPDRVPVTVHDWQKYHLQTYMRGITDIDAFRFCELDAAVCRYPFIFANNENWDETVRSKKVAGYTLHEYSVKTPKGILTYSKGENAITVWDIERIIKKKEDILLLKYRDIPSYDQRVFEMTYDELGDDGILRTIICGYQGGCWQEACELFGLENMIMQTFDDPDWVHEFLGILLAEKLQFIDDNIRHAKIDVVETGGGSGSSTVISPKIHEEFCLPYDKIIHEAIRSCGKKSVYHICGGMLKIVHLIEQNGCDACETFSPHTIGGDIKDEADMKSIAGVLRGKRGMIGGIDQINVLTEGTMDDVRAHVQKVCNTYAPGGGFTACACDHFFDAPVENIKAYAHEAKQYVY